jgi:hypothetical protein
MSQAVAAPSSPVFNPASPLKRRMSQDPELEDGEVPVRSILATQPLKLAKALGYRKPAPHSVTSRTEALELNLAIASTRVFNGVNYDSFDKAVFVRIDDCEAVTGVSKYGKILFRSPEDALAPYNSVMCVAASMTPTDYTFMPPGHGLDADTARFKWNVAKAKNCSMLVSRVAVNKTPLQGDKGTLILEVSGLYRNDALKTSGVVSRIVSFALNAQ